MRPRSSGIFAENIEDYIQVSQIYLIHSSLEIENRTQTSINR